VACENDKESTTHTLEGVGILTLNETCRGYGSRDVLVPGKIDHAVEYLDSIPNSKIKDNISVTQSIDIILNDEDVINNHMDDLDFIAKSREELHQLFENKKNMLNLEKNRFLHSYILYLIIAIFTFTFLLTIVYHSKKIIENRRAHANYTNELQQQETRTPTFGTSKNI
jgi:hypothetical protein